MMKFHALCSIPTLTWGLELIITTALAQRASQNPINSIIPWWARLGWGCFLLEAERDRGSPLSSHLSHKVWTLVRWGDYELTQLTFPEGCSTMGWTNRPCGCVQGTGLAHVPVGIPVLRLTRHRTVTCLLATCTTKVPWKTPTCLVKHYHRSHVNWNILKWKADWDKPCWLQ